MKTKLILLIASLCLFYFTYAQKDEPLNLYVNFEFGYSIPFSNGNIGSPRAEVGRFNYNLTDEGSSLTNSFGSRGAGYKMASTVGYNFNKNIALEMEFVFLRSQTVHNATNEVDTNDLRFFASQESWTRFFTLSPSLVFNIPTKKQKFTPYAKFGLHVPVAGATWVNIAFDDETGYLSNQLLPVIDPTLIPLLEEAQNLGIPISTSSEIKAKTRGNFSLGFKSAMGTRYNFNDKFSIYAELEFVMLSILAKDTRIMELEIRGDEDLVMVARDVLGYTQLKDVYTEHDMPQIIRQTNYLDEITESSNTSYEVERRNEPYEQLQFRDPYNNVGLNLGFEIRF